MGAIKHILLTGATGYLGSNLANAFVKRGYKVSVLIRRTSDLKRLDNIFHKLNAFFVEGYDPEELFGIGEVDCVVHTAASYGRRGENLTDVYNANLVFPLSLFQHCIDFRIPTFINTDTSLPAYFNYYSLSKKQFRNILELNKQMQIINLELEYFYGPGDDDSKFITFIISKLLKLEENLALSSGRQIRDFIFIDDVVEAYLIIIEKVHLLDSYISIPVGSGRGVALKDVVLAIKQLMSNSYTKLNFGALPMRDKEIMYSVANINILRALGWRPRTSLETGLRKTI